MITKSTDSTQWRYLSLVLGSFGLLVCAYAFQTHILLISVLIIAFAILGGFFGDFAYTWKRDGKMPWGGKGNKFPGGRSRCDSCDHALNFFDMLPVLGFWAADGKCRYASADGKRCDFVIPSVYVQYEAIGMVIGAISAAILIEVIL